MTTHQQNPFQAAARAINESYESQLFITRLNQDKDEAFSSPCQKPAIKCSNQHNGQVCSGGEMAAASATRARFGPCSDVRKDSTQSDWEGNQTPMRSDIGFESLYNSERELGRGAFGVVHLCSDVRTGEQFACKSILKRNLKTAMDYKDLESEVSTLRRMQDHPAVIQLHGVFEDEECVRLLMEYGEGGDLFDRILKRKYFIEAEAAIACRKIASFLHCAHKSGVMHRDLKPENILLKSQLSDTDIRIADFGSATVFLPGERLKQVVGSPMYIAPEVLNKNYGPGADVWSLGVILYILLSGRPPFHGSTTSDILHNVEHQELDLESGRWCSISNDAKSLVTWMLSREEGKRPTAKQVMRHPWICYHLEKAASLKATGWIHYQANSHSNGQKRGRVEGRDKSVVLEDGRHELSDKYMNSPDPLAEFSVVPGGVDCLAKKPFRKALLEASSPKSNRFDVENAAKRTMCTLLANTKLN